MEGERHDRVRGERDGKWGGAGAAGGCAVGHAVLAIPSLKRMAGQGASELVRARAQRWA